MSSASDRRHLFISHHHKDDGAVGRLLSMLGTGGWDVRNSSIRAKPANLDRLAYGRVSEAVLRRLLLMKISWASSVVVLIGKETHSRPWVKWEIDQANAQGKRIVGVFERGGTDGDVPAELEKYASSIVSWNAKSIKAAIDGRENIFEDSAGLERAAAHASVTSRC